MTVTPAPTPLSAMLRAATHEAHVRLEADLNPIWDHLDRPRYIALLERWYGFIARWEMTTAFNGELHSFFAARIKTPLIAADLQTCGQSPEQLQQIPLCDPAALPFNDRSAALGILYVIEGSTLGGQVIAKRVHDSLGLTPAAGVAYFSSYGPNVMPHWRDTKTLLDAPPFSADGSMAVQAAIDTFEFLRGWLRG